MNKRDLSEADICAKFITPAVTNAGWKEHSQIQREVHFTKGQIHVRGKMVTRGKSKFADYVLYYKPNIPIRHHRGQGQPLRDAKQALVGLRAASLLTANRRVLRRNGQLSLEPYSTSD